VSESEVHLQYSRPQEYWTWLFTTILYLSNIFQGWRTCAHQCFSRSKPPSYSFRSVKKTVLLSTENGSTDQKGFTPCFIFSYCEMWIPAYFTQQHHYKQAKPYFFHLAPSFITMIEAQPPILIGCYSDNKNVSFG